MNKEFVQMVPDEVYQYLIELGSSWTGAGVAVELGCWLGGSTVSLLKGLKKVGYDDSYFCYDRWKASQIESLKAKKQGVDIKSGEDLKRRFMENVADVCDKVQLFQGHINNTIDEYPGIPIEFCLFDAPKKDPLFSKCIRTLSPHWIPGITIVGFLDYYQYMKFPDNELLQAPKRLIEGNKDCFLELKDFWPKCSCKFFKYKKQLPYVH